MNLSDSIEAINKIVDSDQTLSDKLQLLRGEGFKTDYKPMGINGEIGNVIRYKGNAYVQVSESIGKWGYAHCVVLELH